VSGVLARAVRGILRYPRGDERKFPRGLRSKAAAEGQTRAGAGSTVLRTNTCLQRSAKSRLSSLPKTNF